MRCCGFYQHVFFYQRIYQYLPLAYPECFDVDENRQIFNVILHGQHRFSDE